MSRGAVVIKINGDAANFSNELKKVEKDTKDISQNLTKVAAASAIGFGVLTTAIAASVFQYREGEVVGRKTEAIIKSTGGAAGVTADQVTALALSLQKVSNYGDETIQSASNIILKFTNIKRDIFPEVTALALDMAESFGSAEGASEFLGKALNNPIRGMTQLRREGIVFTADQKETIETLVKTGQVAEAQAILIDKLQSKYGGQARAAVDPFIQLKEVMGDVVQVVGSVFAPAFEGAAIALKNAAFYLLEVNPELIRMAAYGLGAVTVILGLTAALTAGALIYLKVTAIWAAYSASAGIAATASALLAGGVKLLGVAFTFLTGPIGLTILAITALGTAIYYFWDNIKAAFSGIIAMASTFFTQLSSLAAGASKIFDGIASFDKSKIEEGFSELTAAYAKLGQGAGEAFATAYNESLAASKAEEVDDSAAEEKRQEKRAKVKEDADYEYEVESEKKKAKLDLEKEYSDELFKIHDEANQLEMNREAFKAVELARIDLDEKKRRLQEEAKYGKQNADIKAFWRSQEMTGTQEAFGNLSTLTRSKNKELFAIGKAAAYANAIVSTAQGITRTLAEYPFPLNVGFAAAVGAAGAVQLATISGQTLNAAKGMSGSGSPFGESLVSTFTPREIVIPERFSEGIKKGEYSLATAKDQTASSDTGNMHVTFGFVDGADEILEVRRIERQKIGIDRG